MTPNNYASAYFEHRTLTKIHDDPYFIGLQKLNNQIMANLASTDTELGGDNNRHVGLGLMVATYISVSVIAFTCPVHLGAVAPLRFTQHELVRLRDDYARAIMLFHEVTEVEKAILE